MSIVAAGLLFATFVKVAKVLPRRSRPWLFVMLAFVGVGVLRWPLFWVVGALAPGSRCGLKRESVMDRVDLSALFLHSLALWFVAVGGPSTILPDFHRYVVEAHHLMTSTEFAELYTLAQACARPQLYVRHADGLASGGMGGRSHDDDPGPCARNHSLTAGRAYE